MIPHYYRGMGSQTRYASHAANKREQRIEALDRLIFNIHALFGGRHLAVLDHADKAAQLGRVQSISSIEYDIVVCTTGHHHLVHDISCPSVYFQHHPVKSEPIWLGLATQQAMAEQCGRYDYYCYLEDDIILHDPYFFLKLQAFNSKSTPRQLLLPQRYELPWISGRLRKHYYTKLYSDYAQWRQSERPDRFCLDFLGCSIELEQPGLIHAGCYFLTAEQFEFLVRKPEYGSSDGIPIDRALDLAATRAIASHFMVYKPSCNNLDFFEVEHGVGNMFDQLELQADGNITWSWSNQWFDFAASDQDSVELLEK